MALAINQNSYITVADALVYFADRLGAEKFTAADEATQAKALTTAALAINRNTFIDSTLALPRSATLTVPLKLAQANCEEALAILNAGGTGGVNERLKRQQEGVKSIKLGNISETYRTDKDKKDIDSNFGLLSTQAGMLLADFLQDGRAMKVYGWV